MFFEQIPVVGHFMDAVVDADAHGELFSGGFDEVCRFGAGDDGQGRDEEAVGKESFHVGEGFVRSVRVERVFRPTCRCFGGEIGFIRQALGRVGGVGFGWR